MAQIKCQLAFEIFFVQGVVAENINMRSFYHAFIYFKLGHDKRFNTFETIPKEYFSYI